MPTQIQTMQSILNKLRGKSGHNTQTPNKSRKCKLVRLFQIPLSDWQFVVLKYYRFYVYFNFWGRWVDRTRQTVAVPDITPSHCQHYFLEDWLQHLVSVNSLMSYPLLEVASSTLKHNCCLFECHSVCSKGKHKGWKLIMYSQDHKIDLQSMLKQMFLSLNHLFPS